MTIFDTLFKIPVKQWSHFLGDIQKVRSLKIPELFWPEFLLEGPKDGKIKENANSFSF